MDDAPTNLHDGRYAIVRLLGEGGQASTFEAVDKKEGRPVAIKRFRVRGAKSWKEVELAEREARVLSSLSHPLLPRYVEHFEEGGELYLVTERIEGESLASLRKRGATLGEEDVIRFLKDASSILDYLHGRAPPVVHRDIKPSNVIRRPDGSFVLIDFGAVRDKMKPEGGSTVVGTFGYMGPEQFQGRAMPASDVYAVGATALAMLSGREPEDLPHKGLSIDVAAALPSGTRPALVRALSAMLEPDPDRRPNRIAPLLGDVLGSNGSSKQTEAKAPKAKGKGKSARERMASQIEQDIGRGIEEAVHEFEEGVMRFTAEWKREGEKHARRAEKRAAKQERKAEKRAARQERQAWRQAHEARRQAHEAQRMERAMQRAHARGGIPAPVVGLMLLGMALGQLAVFVAVRVFVPSLLTVLSVIFGKGMREAATKTFEAGRRAHDAIERAKGVIRSQQEGARIDADTSDAGATTGQDGEVSSRVRIAADEPTRSEDEEALDEALAEAEAAQAAQAATEAAQRKARGPRA